MYDRGHNCQLSDDSGVSFAIETSVVDTILRNISSRGFDAQKDIEPELFNHTLEALNNAVSSVFMDVGYEDDDFDFVNTLKHNNAVFAAFKTHRQQNDIHKQMFNEDGKVRSFAQFRKATESIIRNYNTNWLQTEYNTAIIRAQFAQKWQAMERDRDIYPNVQWLPSTSVNPREAHLALYYKVFAFDDPFLRSNYPGSMWNCKCGAKSTNQAVTDSAEVKSLTKSMPKAQAGLDENPGVTGKLFSDSHPYASNVTANTSKTINDFAKTRFNSAKTTDDAVARFLKLGFGKISIGNATLNQLNVILSAAENVGKYRTLNIGKLILSQNLGSQNSTTGLVGGNYKHDKDKNNRFLTINLGLFKTNSFRPLKSFDEEISLRNNRINGIDETLQILHSKMGISPRQDKVWKKNIKDEEVRKSNILHQISQIEKLVAAGVKPYPNNVAELMKDIDSQIRTVVFHELGHHICMTENDYSFKPYVHKVSDYGDSNSDEYFAECFAKYKMLGEKDLPTDLLTIFKKWEK